MSTSSTLILPSVALAVLTGCPAEPNSATATSAADVSTSSIGDVPDDSGPDGPTTPTTSGGPEPTSTGETTATTSTTQAGVTCGDGVLDPGEGCDEGANNKLYAACTDECQLNVCGDHKVHVAGRAWGRRMAE